jgi:hypothetical protein
LLQNRNKQVDKGHITTGRYCEFIKFLRPGWYGNVERMQNKIMLRQTTTAAMEGTRKKEDHVKD